MSKDEVKERMQQIGDETVNKACDLLRAYNRRCDEYLAEIVASVCDVNVEDLLCDTKHIRNSHARWLYWYAYRYMTRESYKTISERHSKYKRFTEGGVGISIARMNIMIDQEPIWKKRWLIIRNILRAIEDESMEYETTTLTLNVVPPKGIDVKINLNNKK